MDALAQLALAWVAAVLMIAATVFWGVRGRPYLWRRSATEDGNEPRKEIVLWSEDTKAEDSG